MLKFATSALTRHMVLLDGSNGAVRLRPLVGRFFSSSSYFSPQKSPQWLEQGRRFLAAHRLYMTQFDAWSALTHALGHVA